MGKMLYQFQNCSRVSKQQPRTSGKALGQCCCLLTLEHHFGTGKYLFPCMSSIFHFFDVLCIVIMIVIVYDINLCQFLHNLNHPVRHFFDNDMIYFSHCFFTYAESIFCSIFDQNMTFATVFEKYSLEISGL